MEYGFQEASRRTTNQPTNQPDKQTMNWDTNLKLHLDGWDPDVVSLVLLSNNMKCIFGYISSLTRIVMENLLTSVASICIKYRKEKKTKSVLCSDTPELHFILDRFLMSLRVRSLFFVLCKCLNSRAPGEKGCT